MDKLLTTLLDPEALTRIRKPLLQASTLPPNAYIDPKIFDLEKQQIFHQDWICVTRVEQLSTPGDYLSIDLIDLPVVVSRTLAGDICAFSRICLHRAMPVVAEDGNANRFVCPYHHWTYEMDGSLRSAPMMQGALDFDTRDCRLPQLAVEIWQGFIFVNVNRAAAPLADQLDQLEALLAPFSFEGQEVVDTLIFDSPWNWKILVENFMEAYHHIGPHRTTFEPVYPAHKSYAADNRGAPWALLHMPTEDESSELIAACIYPTCLIAVSGHGGIWYQLEPEAHDRMNLKIHILMPTGVKDTLDADALDAFRQQVAAVHLEDIAVNEGPWQGLHSPAARQGRLSPYEACIWQLNQLWLNHMSPE